MLALVGGGRESLSETRVVDLNMGEVRVADDGTFDYDKETG